MSSTSPESVEPEVRVDLTGLSEASLLGLMSAQRSDPVAARDAWGELYGRYSRYVFRVLTRDHSRHLCNEGDVADVVVDTFHAAFDWAAKQPGGEAARARFDSPDREIVRRRVRAWLAVIATRLALHRLRDRRAAPRELSVAEMDAHSKEPESHDPSSSRNRVLLARALEKLTLEELEALHTSLPWYDPATEQFELPRGEAARLASSLGITPEALRQRRHRSLKHLASLLTGPPTASSVQPRKARRFVD